MRWYKAIILSTLLYSADVWPITEVAALNRSEWRQSVAHGIHLGCGFNQGLGQKRDIPDFSFVNLTGATFGRIYILKSCQRQVRGRTREKITPLTKPQGVSGLVVRVSDS